jgi:hypothetical protein
MDCGVEQLVARRAHNPKVAGSSPAPATKANATVIKRSSEMNSFFAFKVFVFKNINLVFFK